MLLKANSRFEPALLNEFKWAAIMLETSSWSFSFAFPSYYSSVAANLGSQQCHWMHKHRIMTCRKWWTYKGSTENGSICISCANAGSNFPMKWDDCVDIMVNYKSRWYPLDCWGTSGSQKLYKAWCFFLQWNGEQWHEAFGLGKYQWPMGNIWLLYVCCAHWQLITVPSKTPQ